MKIIKFDKSIIPACDFSELNKLKELVNETCSIDGIGAYKIGFGLVIANSLKSVVGVIKDLTDLPVIFDYQKAATDIPELGKKFAQACRNANVNAVILFPMAGPETERAWIEACLEAGLGVIVGGEMTHKSYLESDNGFISDNAPKRIYEIACKLKVNNFVVPGNKPNKISEYKKIIEANGIKPIFYAPGFISQGGQITEAAKAAGEEWHAIIGRALYEAENMHKTAKELVKAIK